MDFDRFAYSSIATEIAQRAAAPFEMLGAPILILRADFSIAYVNPRAAALLDEGRVIVQRHGFLSRIGSISSEEIRLGAERAACGGAQRVEGVAMLDGERRIGVCVRDVSRNGFFTEAWAGAWLLMSLDVPDLQAEERWMQWLARRFDLTQAEVSVLAGLGTGLTVDEIAAERGVSAATVRAQVAALFSKTGRRRQCDLVRLLLGR